MKTVACPKCSFANADADVNSACARCGEPLASALLQENLDAIRKLTEKMQELTAPSFTSFNGFGTTLLDYHRRDDGAWEATRWVVGAMLPLVPLSTFVIRPKRQENSYGRMEAYFDILGRAPLSAARILRVYALVVVGLAPVVLGFMNSSWVNRTLGGPMAALAMLVAIVWGVYILFFKIKNDSKAYKAESAKASRAE